MERTRIRFEDGLEVNGDFDSGNIAKVERVGTGLVHVWPRPDGCGKAPFRSWFHFSVTGVEAGKTFGIVVRQINRQNSLFRYNHRISMRVGVDGEWVLFPGEALHEPDVDELPRELIARPRGEADRGGGDGEDEDDGVGGKKEERYGKISWNYRSERKEDVVFFALCFPLSYEECCADLEKMERRFGNDATREVEDDVFCEGGVYFCRELLVRSKGGRRVELITITEAPGEEVGKEREPWVVGSSKVDEEVRRLNAVVPKALDDEEMEKLDWFPNVVGVEEGEGMFPERGEGRRRPLVFRDKPVVLFSARVHPGETPASHAMRGMLKLLGNVEDERARYIRKHFVVKLIPMLNPDGVAEGHYRADLNGVNLNRVYQSPSIDLHPSIYASRSIATHHASRGRLLLYLDLHAHVARRGAFFYGNFLSDACEQVENVLYTRLAALHCPWIDLGGSNFSKKNMGGTDSAGISKSGSGRVGIWSATGISRCYTLEINYNMARTVAPVPAPDRPLPDLGEPSYAPGMSPPKFTPAHFEHVGRACLFALLELVGMHPHTLLPQSEYRSLEGARRSVLRRLTSKANLATQARQLRSGTAFRRTEAALKRLCTIADRRRKQKLREARLKEQKERELQKQLQQPPPPPAPAPIPIPAPAPSIKPTHPKKLLHKRAQSLQHLQNTTPLPVVPIQLSSISRPVLGPVRRPARLTTLRPVKSMVLPGSKIPKLREAGE